MGSLKQPSPFKEVPNITTGDTVDQAQTGRSAPEILDEIVSVRDVELFDPDKAENVYDKLEAEIADLKYQIEALRKANNDLQDLLVEANRRKR